MDKVWWWIMDVILPVVLLVALVWLVFLRRSRGTSADTERATLIQHLFEGQYTNPLRIVAFNTAEGWSRDATEEIVRELRERCADEGRVPDSLEAFLDR